jgi:hypothetical protein
MEIQMQSQTQSYCNIYNETSSSTRAIYIQIYYIHGTAAGNNQKNNK